MSQFLRTGAFIPVQPELLLYLPARINPRLSIDAEGQLWIKPGDEVWVGLEPGPIKSPDPAHILYGDVPVIIHTKFEFSIFPMSAAPPGTGPSSTSTSTEGVAMKDGFVIIRTKGEPGGGKFDQTSIYQEGLHAASGQVADILEDLEDGETIEVKKMNYEQWKAGWSGTVAR